MNNQERRQYKDIYGKIASEKSKEAKIELLKKGIPGGGLPLGYTWTRVGSKRRGYSTIIVDDQKAQIAKDIFTMYATGAYTYKALADEVIHKYGLNKHKFAVQQMLSNTFYRGILTSKEHGTFPHKFPLFIDEKLFDRVQKILESRKSFKGKSVGKSGKPFLYRALLKCGVCGLVITCEQQKKIVYYHCTQSKGKHKAPWLNEKTITEQIRTILKKITEDHELFSLVADYSLEWPHPNMHILRIVLNTLFKKLIVEQNGDINYVLWTPSEIRSLAERKETVTVDPKLIDANGNLHTNIELLCMAPQTIDFICKTLEKDLAVVQEALVDLQLEGKIDQNLEGLWVTL